MSYSKEEIKKVQEKFPEILSIIREEPIEITFYHATQTVDALKEITHDYTKKLGSTCDAAWSYPFQVSVVSENGEMIAQQGKIFMTPYLDFELDKKKVVLVIEDRMYKIEYFTNFRSHIEMNVSLMGRSSVNKTP